MTVDEKVGIEELEMIGRQLRVDSIRATTQAGSGHPTSSMSAADLAAVLFGRYFRFDATHPDRVDNDRFVLSKGHASPLLYAVMAAFGLIDRDLLPTLREAGSVLEGHPVPTLPLVDVATGSLGQGLSNGLGMAIGQQMLDLDARTWVVLGDSEVAEGSVWEAVELAGHRQADNLVAMLDMNRLGQRGPTMHEWDASSYLGRAEALGWAAIELDGHDFEAIDAAMAAAVGSDKPTMLIARTVKGKGVSFLENAPGRHGKALDEDETRRAMEELGPVDETSWPFAGSPDGSPPEPLPPVDTARSAAEYDQDVSTRDAFGSALEMRVTEDGPVVVLDGEVADSTRTKAVHQETPGRFVESFIAEQNMIGMASGLQALGFHPVAATFGAFLSRAHDFIRMAEIGRAKMTLVGSHAGVSIGQDGPSQMALDDVAMMRGLGALVLYPADGNSTVGLLDLALDHDGISYLRTTRGSTPHLYPPSTTFEVGGSHVHRSSERDQVTIVGAGVTVFEALEAAERLADEGIAARVIDAYSVAPLDVATLASCMKETGALVVVEDHRPAGGLGEAVAAAVAAGDGGRGRILSLAVTGIPGSAKPTEQRRRAGIDAQAIVEAVKSIQD